VRCSYLMGIAITFLSVLIRSNHSRMVASAERCRIAATVSTTRGSWGAISRPCLMALISAGTSIGFTKT
jgi:hypothetical protein